METAEKSIEVLNDLIQINNDRVKGFERAIKELDGKDADLQAIFQNGVNESNLNAQELTTAVTQLGGEAETGTSGSGTIHRAWLDVKATFSGHDAKSIWKNANVAKTPLKKLTVMHYLQTVV